MRPTALQTLTWATVAAAVASALWLAVVESDPGATLHLTASSAGLLPLARRSNPAAMGIARRRDNESASNRLQPQR